MEIRIENIYLHSHLFESKSLKKVFLAIAILLLTGSFNSLYKKSSAAAYSAHLILAIKLSISSRSALKSDQSPLQYLLLL